MQTKSTRTHAKAQTHTSHPVPVLLVNSRRLHSDDEAHLIVISHFIRWVGINASKSNITRNIASLIIRRESNRIDRCNRSSNAFP